MRNLIFSSEIYDEKFGPFFIASFSSTNLGDVSPNTDGARCHTENYYNETIANMDENLKNGPMYLMELEGQRWFAQNVAVKVSYRSKKRSTC